MSEEEKNNKFENITLDDAKKTMQNIFNDITPKEFEEIKKQAIENVKSKENKDIIFINGKPIIINFNDNKPDDKPIIDANHTLLKMNDNWYVVDKVFYDYVDKYQQAIYKIKEYIKENKYKKMGGYGDNEDEDIEECLFEDDIWEIEKLLEEIE